MIRLEIYQETAHFRIPTIGNPYLSYPLPPPSTVYGFLRAITNYEGINPENTKVSIQGKFDGISFEKERLFLEKQKKKNTNIISIQKLHQCFWVIHIDSPLFEGKILNGVQNSSKILRLGRREDLIIDISIEPNVKLKEFEKDSSEYKDDFRIYSPWAPDRDLSGSLFRVALDSKLDSENKITGYEFVNLLYTSARKFSKFAEAFDGEYIVQWISHGS